MNPMHDLGGYGIGLGIPLAVAPLVVVLVLWSIVWKGLGLWHAAKRGETWWFVALLLLNTAGILEIVYLLVFAKMKLSDLFPFMGKNDETVVVEEPRA